MKRCPSCGKTYNEPLNYCLDDGDLLFDDGPQQRPFDDTPPTVMMSDARTTNPTNWSAPPAQYQSPQMWQPQPMYAASPNQTLGVVSLCLGIGSLTVGWCCSLGLLLGPAALITGWIGLSQTHKDPQRYGGRGLAIAGMITGGVFLALYLLFILFYGAAIFLGGLGN